MQNPGDFFGSVEAGLVSKGFIVLRIGLMAFDK